MRSATPLQLGAVTAGKYQLVRELGRGGMGLVYEARHVDLDVPVALKLVLPEYAQSPEITQRLLEEARSAARVRNEHVVGILDVGVLGNGSPFIVMEYVEGRSLQAHLDDRKRLPLAEAVDYVSQACLAIIEAHANNVVHRDLKPDNLLLTRRSDGSPLIKVVDFGLSKRLDRQDLKLTDPSLTMGSPQYMSPEQITAAGEVDARTDIWSLGVVLYELTTGRSPFDADSVMQLFGRILQESPLDPSELEPSLPPEFDALVARCLCVDRDERFGSARELLEALMLLSTGARGADRSRSQLVSSGPATLAEGERRSQWRWVGVRDGSGGSVRGPDPSSYGERRSTGDVSGAATGLEVSGDRRTRNRRVFGIRSLMAATSMRWLTGLLCVAVSGLTLAARIDHSPVAAEQMPHTATTVKATAAVLASTAGGTLSEANAPRAAARSVAAFATTTAPVMSTTPSPVTTEATNERQVAEEGTEPRTLAAVQPIARSAPSKQKAGPALEARRARVRPGTPPATTPATTGSATALGGARQVPGGTDVIRDTAWDLDAFGGRH